ncbi:MAG: CADD family putative folate metabolism protein [Rhodanobacteraceae bacterium]
MIDSFWREIESILEAKSLLKHPFYLAWTAGTLTREDLAHYARQYYAQEARFPRYVSAVHSNCPELNVRQSLVENLVHEESGPQNHPELWLAFAGAVGASRESVENAELEAGTEKCLSTFDRLSRSDWRCGLASLYAYESQQPAVAKTKIEGLKGNYGLDTQAALGFFEAHETMDVWHAESEKTMLTEAVRKDPSAAPKIEAAISDACDALNALLDGVCIARGIGCEAAA